MGTTKLDKVIARVNRIRKMSMVQNCYTKKREHKASNQKDHTIIILYLSYT